MTRATTADPNFAPEFTIEHLDGVAWWNARRPRWWHQCRPQSRALDRGLRIYRCACGAIALDRPSRWMDRNSRR